MRHTRGHTRNRRSHHGLRPKALVKCEKCGELKLPHIICQNCGIYKNRQVVDVLKKLTKKERKQKEKELAEKESDKQASKPLDATELSRKK